jgi:hypothetical protein
MSHSPESDVDAPTFDMVGRGCDVIAFVDAGHTKERSGQMRTSAGKSRLEVLPERRGFLRPGPRRIPCCETDRATRHGYPAWEHRGPGHLAGACRVARQDHVVAWQGLRCGAVVVALRAAAHPGADDLPHGNASARGIR